MTVRVALASFDQAWEDKAENLRRCRDLARRAAAHGADLIAFPEMTLTGFTMNAGAIVEEAATSPTIEAFCALAGELHVNIAFGVVLAGRSLPKNSLVVVGRDGVDLARYDKIHPFSHAHEDEHYEAGSCIAVAVVDDVAFGLTICYDLRFPEIYTALAPLCSVLLVIANWPAARIGHWHALLVARAIECQAYVVAVNRTGADGNGIVYPRASRVIDPHGQDVAPDLTDGELELFTIDAHAVQAYRRAFPTLRDRKPALYGRLSLPDLR